MQVQHNAVKRTCLPGMMQIALQAPLMLHDCLLNQHGMDQMHWRS